MLRIVVILLCLLPLARAQGLSFDPCRTNSECQLPRTCNTISDVTAPCNPSTNCFCVPPAAQFCTNPEQCPGGETCFALETIFSICGSATAVQNENAATVITSPIGNGFTLDQCSTPSDCTPNRECKLIDSKAEIQDLVDCPNSGFCLCIPSVPDIVLCTRDSDCIPEEVCVSVSGSEQNRSLCISPFAEARDKEVVRVEPLVADGLTQDPCQFSAECKASRQCVSLDVRPCIDRSNCKCFQDRVCGTSDQCEAGEVCARAGDVQQCMSKNFVDSSSQVVEVNDPGMTPTTKPIPSGSLGGAEQKIPSVFSGREGLPTGETQPPPLLPICIGTDHLKDLSSERRVFVKDMVANVLCDPEGSCATPGHMIVFRQRSMMMRSYCELVTCVKRIMHVNSPRYSRGWRGESFTKDMKFTALAARYETKTEEMLLRAAVHVGV